MPVQVFPGDTEHRDHDKCKQDEIARKNRVGDKRVKCLVSEIAGVVQRVAPLLPGGKS